MKEIYMLYPKISKNKTGIVVSMLRRANLLANAGYKVFLVTTEYDPNTRLYFNNCYDSGLLTNRKNIKMVNIFSFFQEKDVDNYCSQANKMDQNYQLDPKNNRVYVYGNNKKYEVFDGDRRTHTNIFHEKELRYRIKYDDYGKLCSLQQILNKSVISDLIYDVIGRLVLKVEYYYIDNKKNVSSITLFNRFFEIEYIFSSMNDFFEYTIHKYICNAPDILYYFFIDRISVFDSFFLSKHPNNYYFIGTIHAAHYQNYKDIYSMPNKRYIPYFMNIHKLEALIILTEQQKQDIIRIYGDSRIYQVIPHTLSHEPINYNVQPDFSKFVSLSRYDKGKRLDLLIDIFAKVLHVHPNVSLEMYGFGAEKENLEKMIIDKRLCKSIRLHSFSKNIDEIFQSSSMLLVSSQSESFCLVIMEALANGCPVTSFDIRYGPNEMIQDNLNGYLIQEGDIEGYANKIIEYLNDSQKMLDMRINALELSKQRSKNNIVKIWDDLFNTIQNKSTQKNKSF